MGTLDDSDPAMEADFGAAGPPWDLSNGVLLLALAQGMLPCRRCDGRSDARRGSKTVLVRTPVVARVWRRCQGDALRRVAQNGPCGQRIRYRLWNCEQWWAKSPVGVAVSDWCAVFSAPSSP